MQANVQKIYVEREEMYDATREIYYSRLCTVIDNFPKKYISK